MGRILKSELMLMDSIPNVWAAPKIDPQGLVFRSVKILANLQGSQRAPSKQIKNDS